MTSGLKIPRPQDPKAPPAARGGQPRCRFRAPLPPLPRSAAGPRPCPEPARAPFVPPLPLSALLPLSRLVTGAAGQSAPSRPASPPADWPAGPEPSANRRARRSLRQRQQLWQRGPAPPPLPSLPSLPAPRACSAAAAPWRRASGEGGGSGRYHLRAWGGERGEKREQRGKM